MRGAVVGEITAAARGAITMRADVADADTRRVCRGTTWLG